MRGYENRASLDRDRADLVGRRACRGPAPAAAAEIATPLCVRLRAARGRRRQPVPVEARGNGHDRHVGGLLPCRPPERHADLGRRGGSRCGHQARGRSGAMEWFTSDVMRTALVQE